MQDIEGFSWPAASPEDTYVIRTIHRLRQVPIEELGVEDLRIMLSQDVGTAAVLPRALDQLEADPLTAGHFSPGALLCAVLRLPEDRWSGSPGIVDKLRDIAQRADAMVAELEGTRTSQLRGSLLKFLSEHPELGPGRSH
ncbi:contact-dependent growth inhibition system immunity protein [Nocardia neocaledoniensis]|uniref:contact-dependent growth inhibition system immunity protein n=1 Tax=Nocardia neocaledoniensis TaxID=236511 RepID=UPI0024551971|nr:contact-dependent growth inhibition system immunity protein [Nocardia neocaledoniensis]